jgi:hypothetical protein
MAYICECSTFVSLCIFRNPDYLSLALKRQKFSAAVGGVAFDQVAMHDEGVAVHQDCTPIEIIALGGQP